MRITLQCGPDLRRRAAARALLAAAGLLFAAAPASESGTGEAPPSLHIPAALSEAELWLRRHAPAGTLDGIDLAAVRGFLDGLQNALHDEYVLDLADFKETAAGLLKILQQLPPARPYASWLEARMDYFEAAETLRVVVRERAARRTPRPPDRRRPPAPTYADTTGVWKEQVGNRPPPRAAAGQVSSLKSIFAAEGVPPELVWLAEVESSFDPRARSPAGAAGMFQFMPATAERFGLALAPRDERLHPRKSARAAARYLKFLHGRFGSWPLALAAYNAGEGRVGRTLERTGGRRFADIAPHLPAETQLYVPKVMAVVEKREGVRLQAL